MTVKELCELIEAADMTPEADKGAEVSCGYTCDLLSWVIPEGIEMEAPSLEKAREEGINVLQTPLTAYEICARLAAAGLPGKSRD